ncbi:MAG: TIGR02996 domain-containing protein [Kofleriaceae bacterium]
MLSADALVEAILAAPEDDAPRLVLSDWLLEQGDPRGELIAVQCALARADAADERLVDRRRAIARERALLESHGDAWSATLREIAVARYVFRRGFVEHVEDYQGRDLGVVCQQLRPHAPLLRSATVSSTALQSLFTRGRAEFFESLLLERPSLSTLHLQLFAEALADGRLSRLELNAPYIPEADTWRTLAELPFPLVHLGALVKAARERVANPFLDHLGAAEVRRSLRSLSLANIEVGAARALGALRALETLVVEDGQVVREAFATFAELPALTSLDLASTTGRDPELGGFALGALLRGAPALRRLRLSGVGLGDADAIAIADHAGSARLRRLDLARNRIGDAGARAIAESPHLRALIRLNLNTNAIGSEAKQRLRAWAAETGCDLQVR